MQTTVKVVKCFGVDEGANIIALYLRTDQPEESFNHLRGQAISIKPLEEGTEEEMGRATKDQMRNANTMLKEGKSPVEVCAAIGISLRVAYSLQKKLREAGQLPGTKSKTTKEPKTSPIPLNQVKSSLMTEADIKKYGLPDKTDISNVPKEFRLEIGPVGVSLADKVVAETLKPLKAIGITDVSITVTAGGGNV